MGSGKGRVRNLGMNVLLVVVSLIAVLLAWAFVGRLATEPNRTGPGDDPIDDFVQVDVRNGCGVSGLAARMTQYLRQRGFDVVEVGDHLRFDEPATFVLDRIGNPLPSRILATAVGIPEDRIREDIRTDYYLDATLVIGCDYASIRPFRDDDS